MSVNPAKLEELRITLESKVTANRNSAAVWKNTLAEPFPFEHDIGNNLVVIAPVPYVATDVNRIAQTAIEQTNWLKETNGGESFTTRDQRLYRTFEDFAMDATHCVIGRDPSNRPISRCEELERTWVLFVNVLNSPDPVVLGRDHDIFHTGVLVAFKGISEYTSGQILAMEKWTFGGNNALMMAILKGHKTVTSLTTFSQVSQQVSEYSAAER